MAHTVGVASQQAQWRLEPFARVLAATILLGAVAGAVIGGLGGRLAMRVLLLTSDDALRGVRSDDGFVIGKFDIGDTLGLVATTTILGIFAALLFLAAWPFVARLGPGLVPVATVFYGVVGGALLVHTDGVDFTLIEPAWLAIALFVALPAAFGAAVAFFVGQAARAGAWPRRAPWWLLGPLLVPLAFPPFLAAAAVATAMDMGETTFGNRHRGWRAVHLVALGVMSGLFVLGAVKLARDTATLT